NLLFTTELQRRLADAGSAVRAMAVHPGYSATNLQSRTGSGLMNVLGAVGNRIFAQSEDMGALPTLYAATQDLPGDSFVGPDGFQEQRGHPTLVGRSTAAQDRLMARRLWELSETLTGVTFPPTPGRERERRPAIVAVDDEPAVLAAVARDLRRGFGDRYRILRATSGPEALDLVRQVRARGEQVAMLVADQR